MLTPSNIVYQILPGIWPCFMFTWKHMKLLYSVYNTICKPTLPTELRATWSFATTVFWGGSAIVHKFPIPLQGTHLYRAEDPKALQGQCHEIFLLLVFSWISFPHAPDYTIRAFSNFFENSRRYSQLKVCQWKKSSIRKIFMIFFWHLG